MPDCKTLFLYGTKKNIMFHSEGFLRYLRNAPGCAAMGIEGGHWFFLDKTDQVLKIMWDFMDGVLYSWADKPKSSSAL